MPKYISKRGQGRVIAVEMPELEPTCNPAAVATRRVHLLALSTNSLWIGVQDIEWLVNWLEAEHRSGGVALTDEAAVAVLEGNCGVPNVHIRWNFEGAWEAIVLAGPKKGISMKSYVKKMTAEKWQTVAGLHNYKMAYADAKPADRKLATYHYVEAFMKHTMDETEAIQNEPAVAGAINRGESAVAELSGAGDA